MRDKYANFAVLAAGETEGVDFEIVVTERSESRVAIIAPHAGGIERATGRIAERIAGADFSCYRFRGLKRNGNRNLHITSHHFDEPRCLALIGQHDWVVAIHGCNERGEHIFLGGLDNELIKRVKIRLEHAGLPVNVDSHKYPASLKLNICNRGRCGAGIQLELSRQFRTGDRLSIFVDAVREVLLERLNAG